MKLLDKLFIGTLLVVFGGVILHAPLTVGLQTLFPDAALGIKAWKEVILIIASLLLMVILTVRDKWSILKNPIFYVIAAYAVLHLLLIPFFATGTASVVSGLMIDLRYILFFVLVYAAARMYPQFSKQFIWVGVAGALVVMIFAILQLTVLPHDILKHIGYGISTIMPFMTVDENMDFIRINSTLRGPNPLGAYAVIVLAVAAAFLLTSRRALKNRAGVIIAIVSVGGAMALWASYSRSALVAGVVALAIIALVTVARRLPRWVWIALCVVALGLAGGLYAARDTHFVSHVILHEDPNEGNDTNSNDGHVESLVDGTDRMISQPLGGGIGSTGSASLLGDNPLIIENQYLYIAHEVGWLGIILFGVLFVMLLKGLWKKRKNWLALGIFASGISLALIGLLLPVWADDTVSIVWWGLAALALAGSTEKQARKK